ncbi:MAG: hypothetical protein HUU11_16860 [Anaerolineales bacterium]|nr:hypothetical protein [Anaerolineales bacterium]
MSLVTAEAAKKQINTPLSDEDLQEIIDRIESQITARIGAPWDGDDTPSQVVKTLRGEGPSLFLPTGIYEVVSIVEDDAELTADEYRVWGNGGVIERLPIDSGWGRVCTVTYKPMDDRFKRIPVIIDLLRLTLERTAMKSESIAGEYSYTAPDNWDAEFRKAMKRLQFKAL